MKILLTTLFLIISFLGLSQPGQDTVHIYFDFDSDTPLSNSLEKLLEFNKEYEVQQFHIKEIRSHTDTTGSRSYNEALSKRRLKSVKEQLTMPLEGCTMAFVGENEATISKNYKPEQFRRVDIIYSFPLPPLEVEIPEPHNALDKKNIESELSTFVDDTTSTEILIQLSVNFVPGQDILLPGEEQELFRLLSFMVDNPNIKAHIRGHVCCADNMELSIQRAFVVYEFLVKHYISPTRLSYDGYSNTIPFTWPEVTEEDKISNRRVDVVFKK